LNQAEFAKAISRTEPYVTELKKAGRLVYWDEEQTDIDPDASLKKIIATKDIARTSFNDGEATDKNMLASGAYAQARALKEKYNAMAAKRDYEISIGQLLHVDDVKMVIAQGDGIIRDRLESIPEVLAPQLALETDEVEIKYILQRAIDGVIASIGRTYKDLSK
jgi:hypothetical protein